MGLWPIAEWFFMKKYLFFYYFDFFPNRLFRAYKMIKSWFAWLWWWSRSEYIKRPHVQELLKALTATCLPCLTFYFSRGNWRLKRYWIWRETFTGKNKALKHCKSFFLLSASYAIGSGPSGERCWFHVCYNNDLRPKAPFRQCNSTSPYHVTLKEIWAQWEGSHRCEHRMVCCR